MATFRRNIASIPIRSAVATWETIVEAIAPTNAANRAELLAATGIAASLITREVMRSSPIIVTGNGPRVRIYCVYGDKAVDGANVDETVVAGSPGESEGWGLSFPCLSEDLEWVTNTLGQISPRISARDMAESDISNTDEGESVKKASINLEALRRI